MKKLSLLLMVLFLVPSVLAIAVAPFPVGDVTSHDQYYYVVFDGEGEASSILRLDMQNLENLTSLELEIPGEDARIINVVQEWYQYRDVCRYYEEKEFNEEGVAIQECAEYYKQRIYPAKYTEAEYEVNQLSDSVLLNVELPKSDQDQVTLIVHYKSESYVEKRGGVFKYNFETAKTKYDTDNVRVSIDVAEDLYIKGGDSEIEYKEQALSARADVAEFASYIPNIYTGYTETASSLDPYESFHVDGKYAKSWWTVNWWKPVLGILLALAIIIGVSVGLMRLNKKKRSKTSFSILVGIGTGLLLSASWIGVGYILQNVQRLVGYNSVFPMFIMMLTVLWSLFLFIGPSLLVGWSRGTRYGVYCFVATLVSSFLLVIVTLVLLLLLTSGPSPIYPVYY